MNDLNALTQSLKVLSEALEVLRTTPESRIVRDKDGIIIGLERKSS